MLSSDRLRTSDADDHDESNLWERLRSEANRRSSMIPAAPSQPSPARLEDFRAEFESADLGNSELPSSRWDTEMRASYTGMQQASHAHENASSYHVDENASSYEDGSYEEGDYEDAGDDEGNTPLASYTAELAPRAHEEAVEGAEFGAYEGEQFEGYQGEHDHAGLQADESEEYARSEYEAQQYAHQQYGLDRLTPQPPEAQHAQSGQFGRSSQFGQQQAPFAQFGQQPGFGHQAEFTQHTQFAPHDPAQAAGQYGQQGFGPAPYVQGQIASLGQAQPQQQGSFAPPAQWAQPSLAASVTTQATAAMEAGDGKLRSRWGKPLMALGVLAAIGAAGYQFVLVPREEQARAAELAELQTRQAVLIEQQEKEAREAAARAEAEQRAANEAALKRADEAAAAAAAAETEPAVGKAGSKGKSADDGADRGDDRSERRARARAERHERHERRAAARAAKSESAPRAERSSSRTEKAEIASSKPAKKGKSEGGGMSEADNDDPLLGL